MVVNLLKLLQAALVHLPVLAEESPTLIIRSHGWRGGPCAFLEYK